MSDTTLADQGHELFSSKKKRNIPTGKKATTTNLPFSFVRLGSTSKEGLSSYRDSTGIQNSLLRRIEEEEKNPSPSTACQPLLTSPSLPGTARLQELPKTKLEF